MTLELPGGRLRLLGKLRGKREEKAREGGLMRGDAGQQRPLSSSGAAV